MKFVYIGAFRFPVGDAAAARVLNVARALRLAGHKVSFISWGGEQRECDCCMDGKYRIDGFEYIVTNELDPTGSLINKVRGKITRGKKTKQLLYENLGKYDAIITYNGNLSGWLLRFAKRNKLKLICDFTEWYEYNELKFTDWLPYTFNMCCIQKRIKNKIVISSFFDGYYNTTHNIVIPATCDKSEDKWKREKGILAERRVGKYDGITLIYAGTPARKDAIHFAINAVQHLIEDGANIRFIIIGTERDKYIKDYRDLLKVKDLSNRIQFLGRVSQDDVPSYYALADFMVLLRESTRKNNAGFPTKFSESFISGTPVIANLTSDLGNYLKDGVTGFVVEEPSESAIYRTLKEKVLPLNQENIETIKKNVREASKRLDYHTYIEPLRQFMSNLK